MKCKIRKKYILIMICFIMMISVFSLTKWNTINNANNQINAQDINTLYPDKIVDFSIIYEKESANQGTNYVLFNDEWGNAYYVQVEATEAPNLRKVTLLNDKEGNPLTDVEKIRTTTGAWQTNTQFKQKFGAVAIRKGGKSLYYFGYNEYGQAGTGSKNVESTRIVELIDLNSVLGEGEFVVEATVAPTATMLVTNQGNVYGAGKNDEGQLATLPEKEYLRFTKLTAGSLRDIKKIIHASVGGFYALRNDGTLWGWGPYVMSRGGARPSFEKEPFHIHGGGGQGIIGVTDISNTASAEDVKDTSVGYGVLRQVDGKLYAYNYGHGATASPGGLDPFGNPNLVITLTDPDSSIFVDYARKHGIGNKEAIGVVANGKYYRGWGDQITPYIKGEVTNDTKVKKAVTHGTHANDQSVVEHVVVLSEDGNLYIDGQGVSLLPFQLTKSSDGTGSTSYTSGSKTNENVTIDFEYYGKMLQNFQCEVKDLLDRNGTFKDCNSEIKGDTANKKSITILAEEGKPVKREYKISLGARSHSFVVDIYKKLLTIQDLENDQMYQLPKTIVLGDNSYADAVSKLENITPNLENTNDVTATLQCTSGVCQSGHFESSKNFESNTELREEGTYQLVATDTYGNTSTINFILTPDNVVNKIIFTPNNPLIYNTTNTIKDGIIGTIQAKQNNQTVSISSANVISGTSHNKFSIETIREDDHQVGKLKVISDTPIDAGTYTLEVTVQYGQSKSYTGQITFTVEKAENTMDWNAQTKEYGSSGITTNDKTINVGVENVLGDAQVSYRIDPSDNCVSIDSRSGKITLTCMPQSGNITVKATASATKNYNQQEISLTIPARKASYTLQVQMKDPSDSEFKDTVTIPLGGTKPTEYRVVVTPQNEGQDISGFDISYQFKQENQVVEHPERKVGRYTLEATQFHNLLLLV